MLAKDLKIGEYGRVTEGGCKDLIIKRGKYGIFDTSNGAFHTISAYILEVEKLENVKITYDGCKSEYPKMMWVSDDNNFKYQFKKEILVEFKNRFLSLNSIGENFICWKFAKDIETEEELVHLTLEDISKGKGVGVNPELIRIKK